MQAAVPLQIVILKENPPEIQDGPTVPGQEPGQQGVEGLGAAFLLFQPECLLQRQHQDSHLCIPPFLQPLLLPLWEKGDLPLPANTWALGSRGA